MNQLLNHFATGLIAGIGALLMPCIYCMIPPTVGYFTQKSTTRRKGITNAAVYAGYIVLIFTVLGIGVTGIFGSSSMNSFASSAVFNLVAAAMFIYFGLDFLEAFPHKKTGISFFSRLGSKSGIFFLALTLVVSNFSCTVPFIAYLTVSVSKGGILAPVAGFLGFSLSIALPFAVFAFSPTLLKSLPKPGDWFTTLKKSLGIIELALAIKFISSADLAYHWHLLDREVFLSCWIALFGILSIYLFGWLKLKSDFQNIRGIGVPRLICALGTLIFTIYLIPGLWGAPLKSVSAWLPEMSTQDFNLTAVEPVKKETESFGPVKYTDFLKSEIPGVATYFDYAEAKSASKLTGKPILIDFTGHSCVNCRKMERKVLSDPAISSRLKKSFIVASLYVDDKYLLNDSTTLGASNYALQLRLSGNPSQPEYLFVDHNDTVLLKGGGYDPDINKFGRKLDDVLRLK